MKSDERIRVRRQMLHARPSSLGWPSIDSIAWARPCRSNQPVRKSGEDATGLRRRGVRREAHVESGSQLVRPHGQRSSIMVQRGPSRRKLLQRSSLAAPDETRPLSIAACKGVAHRTGRFSQLAHPRVGVDGLFRTRRARFGCQELLPGWRLTLSGSLALPRTAAFGGRLGVESGRRAFATPSHRR